jgi:hypothetical protein
MSSEAFFIAQEDDLGFHPHPAITRHKTAGQADRGYNAIL